jgi:hypothetical protein
MRYTYQEFRGYPQWLTETRAEVRLDTERMEDALQDTLDRYDLSEKDREELLDNALGGTPAAQERGALGKIRKAIARLEDWQGTPVVVHALPKESERGLEFEPTGDARVELLPRRKAWGGTPSFTFWVDPDTVEDVLEYGDTDFFADEDAQADYFALVGALRNPGKRDTGTVALYTARPRKDRSRYEGARDIPAGIFLTTDMSRAAGIAHDLGGGTVRDIWGVRVEKRYLVQTLDTGRLQDYQAVAPSGRKTVPVKFIGRVG